MQVGHSRGIRSLNEFRLWYTARDDALAIIRKLRDPKGGLRRRFAKGAKSPSPLDDEVVFRTHEFKVTSPYVRLFGYQLAPDGSVARGPLSYLQVEKPKPLIIDDAKVELELE